MAYLLSPDIGLVVWTCLVFILALILVSKFGWRPVLDFIDKHENEVKEEIEQAKTSSKALELAKLKYEEKLNVADSEAEDIVLLARQKAEVIKKELITATELKSKELMLATEKSLHAEKEKMMQEVYGMMTKSSVSAVEFLLKRSITSDDQEKLISDFIAQNYLLQDIKKID